MNPLRHVAVVAVYSVLAIVHEPPDGFSGQLVQATCLLLVALVVIRSLRDPNPPRHRR